MKKFAALLMILSLCLFSATGCKKKTDDKTGGGGGEQKTESKS